MCLLWIGFTSNAQELSVNSNSSTSSQTEETKAENRAIKNILKSLEAKMSIEKTTKSNRDITLLLDCSGSMYGTPIETLKEAAKSFCTTVLNKDDSTNIGLIAITSSSTKLLDLTNDIDILTDVIDRISASGGTNLYNAINISNEMLSASDAKEKNIIIMTDGIPESGEILLNGKYTSDDNSNYQYANACIELLQSLDKNHQIYTVGFLHELTGKDLSFCQKFLKDLGTTGYFEANSIDELTEEFKNIAHNITEKTITGILQSINLNNFTLRIDGKNYPVSDDFDMNIAAKILATNTLKKVAAKLENNKIVSITNFHTIGLNLRWGMDSFSFNNSPDSFGIKVGEPYKIDDSLIDNSNFNISDKFLIKNELSKWDGSCFGMSTTTLQLFTKRLELQKLQPHAKNAYNLKKPSKNHVLKNYIGLYQATCTTSKYKKAKNNFINKSQTRKLEILIDKLQNIEKTGIPVLIDYAWVSDPSKSSTENDGGWAAHAVLAYALETENAPYIYEGQEYAYRVRTLNPNTIYNPNLPINTANNDCIYITENLDDFYIPNGGERSNIEKYPLRQTDGTGDELGEAFIQLASDDISILPATDSITQDYNNIIVASSVSKIDDNIINGLNGTGEGIIGQMLIPNGSSSKLNVFLDNSFHEVEILENKQNIEYVASGIYQNIEASKNSTVTLARNADITLNNQNGEFKIIYASNKRIPLLGVNSITIEGSGDKKITVSTDNNGVIVSGNDLKGTTITTEDGEKLEVTTNTNKIRVTSDILNNPSIQEPDTSTHDPDTDIGKPSKTTPKVKKITISGKKSVKAGKSLKLKAKVKAPKGANKKIKWKSSNKKYAKVYKNGKVKTFKKAKGKKVKITAVAVDGSGKKKTVTIKIK